MGESKDSGVGKLLMKTQLKHALLFYHLIFPAPFDSAQDDIAQGVTQRGIEE